MALLALPPAAIAFCVHQTIRRSTVTALSRAPHAPRSDVSSSTHYGGGHLEPPALLGAINTVELELLCSRIAQAASLPLLHPIPA